ncbi:hypothetical protein [Paracidovorax sp. MALMAid1276]|uniref:hypothetical protein n=1 Tax=Paracidovorax sp. MALMAid1276 TaxID=3411631 RepID=UPI003B9A5A46
MKPFSLILQGLILAGLYTPLAQASTKSAQPNPPPATALKTPAPFILAPTVEGLLACDAAERTAGLLTLSQAQAHCLQRRESAAPALRKLLDSLEPGGPRGTVQVGYTVTLQLLALFQRTPKGWEIDNAQVETWMRLITDVQRPVVIYLSSGHFDSTGPLTDELLADSNNLMALRDGLPPKLGYFGYRIAPYTLRIDESIPVNRYRYSALDAVAKRILALPIQVRERIVAVTLAGELHHLFPDFEAGMGRHQDVQVTDYHPESVAEFRRWLAREYGTVQAYARATGLPLRSFDEVSAPSRDIRKESLRNFADHFDAHADGLLPLSGWLWDPQGRVQRLQVHLNGKPLAEVPRGFNRLDVYRALEEITSPNVGFRYELDYSGLPPGRHRVQVLAHTVDGLFEVAEREFTVMERNRRIPRSDTPSAIKAQSLKGLRGVRAWMDLPQPALDLYYNPLARDWNRFRSVQAAGFLAEFHRRARAAGLPAHWLFSHQIVPRANSTWNPQLFAMDDTLRGDAAWNHGLNMYGGMTDSDWMQGYLQARGIRGYGVPEFHPQQWKVPGAALRALQRHQQAGARFISPYYFTVVPQRFKGGAEHGVSRMELSPTNRKDGSDQLYRAIVEFARQ